MNNGSDSEEKLLKLCIELDSFEGRIRRAQFETTFLLKEVEKLKETLKSNGYPIPIPKAVGSETKTYWDFERVFPGKAIKTLW